MEGAWIPASLLRGGASLKEMLRPAHSRGPQWERNQLFLNEATLRAICYSTSPVLTDTIPHLFQPFIQQVLIWLLWVPGFALSNRTQLQTRPTDPAGNSKVQLGK